MRYIYLLRAGESHYKVGISANPLQRIREIQTSNAEVIELVSAFAIRHAERLEKDLHKWLKSHKSDGGTEWFNLSSADALGLAIKIATYVNPDDLAHFLSMRNLEYKHELLERRLDKMQGRFDELVAASKASGRARPNVVDGEDMFGMARELVKVAGVASASMLQRRLRIGYARAARLIDELEGEGIIGPADGARPREVLL